MSSGGVAGAGVVSHPLCEHMGFVLLGAITGHSSTVEGTLSNKPHSALPYIMKGNTMYVSLHMLQIHTGLSIDEGQLVGPEGQLGELEGQLGELEGKLGGPDGNLCGPEGHLGGHKEGGGEGGEGRSVRCERVGAEDARALAALNAHMCFFAYGAHTHWPPGLLVPVEDVPRIVKLARRNEGMLFLILILIYLFTIND